MDHSILNKNIEKLVSQRNCFLFFSVMLSIAVVLLSIMIFFKKEKVVVIPTTGPSFWIEDSRVSSEYLERMGFFLSDLLLNRTPADVEKKNQIILEYVHPAAYQEIRKILSREKENILKDQQSFFFQTERSYVDLNQELFAVEGEFMVLVGKGGEGSFCAQRERKKFTLQFACKNGKLQLISLKKEPL